MGMDGKGSFKQHIEARGVVGLGGVADAIEKGVEAARPYQVAAFLLRGPPGVGKTRIAEEYAEYLGAEKLFYQCTVGVSADDLLYNIIPDENAKSGFRITKGVIWRAVEISKTKKVVMIIDEFDKSRPSTDAFLLDLVQNCRVSVAVGGEFVNVIGNKDNLIVFLTSNDTRDFSEALLRRVICVNLQRISTLEVFKILSGEFPNELALLLAQVYDDSIKAELQKPATIQELRILGRMLVSGADFATALKTVILKNSEDVKKFIEYVQSRKPYEWHYRRGGEGGEVDFGKAYSSGKKYVIVNTNPVQASTNPKVPAVKIKKVNIPTKNPVEVEDDIEYYGVFENVDDDTYTALIKAISPTATDNPCEIGSMKVVKNKGKEYIVAMQPFNFTQISNIPMLDGKVYVEDLMALTWRNVVDILSMAEKIRFYTKAEVGAEYVFSDGMCHVLMRLAESGTVIRGESVYVAHVAASGDIRAVKDTYDQALHRPDTAVLSAAEYEVKTDYPCTALKYLVVLATKGISWTVKIDSDKSSYNFVIGREGGAVTVYVSNNAARRLMREQGIFGFRNNEDFLKWLIKECE